MTKQKYKLSLNVEGLGGGQGEGKMLVWMKIECSG